MDEKLHFGQYISCVPIDRVMLGVVSRLL